MTTKRGDVVLVRFPRSDQRGRDRRPALVVQADGLVAGLPQLVLAMITTNLSRAGHPSRVLVTLSSPVGIASGLLADSVIMTDNLATVLEKAIHSVIGAIPDMADVDAALRHTLGVVRPEKAKGQKWRAHELRAERARIQCRGRPMVRPRHRARCSRCPKPLRTCG